MTTMQRRSHNRITRLKLNDGSWIEEEDQISNNFAQFYSDLFKASTGRNFDQIGECVELLITNDDNMDLMKEISAEEVKEAVFELGSTKAPGPDGFASAFYQNAWKVVGNQVFATDLPGNYLGLPIIWGRSKKKSLNFVVDKIKKQMQGWKQNFLLDAGREDPDQSWAKILKAKYFPKCSFMEAQKGGRASWLWSSIIEGRKVLQGNILSSIGDGENTRVWNDPWISNLPGTLSEFGFGCEFKVPGSMKARGAGKFLHWHHSHNDSEAGVESKDGKGYRSGCYFRIPQQLTTVAKQHRHERLHKIGKFHAKMSFKISLHIQCRPYVIPCIEFGLSALDSEDQTQQIAIFFKLSKASNRYIGLMCSDQSRWEWSLEPSI